MWGVIGFAAYAIGMVGVAGVIGLGGVAEMGGLL
jgi:hypothetical protein